mgnify:CR=1 FL=1
MKKAHGMTRVCTALDVPRSTVYGRLARAGKPVPLQHRRLLSEAAMIHRQTRGCYGRRRMSQALRRRGFDVGPFKARSLMREARLRVQAPRPAIYPKTRGQVHHAVPNHLNRRFNIDVPGTVFAGDITYIWTRQGWLYLAIVMDLASRKIAGWATSDTPDTALVMRACRLALPQRQSGAPPLFHSDQGCQYTSSAFRSFLANHGIKQSMSRRGNCWDNAPVERFFRSLKSEWIGNTVYADHPQAVRDINHYIADFYNTQRLHSVANGHPPAELHAALSKAA